MYGFIQYLLILAPAIDGMFFGMPLISVPLASLALFATSALKHRGIYSRAFEMGEFGRTAAYSTAASSLFHAFVVCGLAFGGGVLLRIAMN